MATVLFSILFALLPSYYQSSETLKRSTLQTRDIFFRIRHWSGALPDEIKNIVLVGIDEDSCDRLGARWPWSRHLFARLLNRLSSSGAQTIALNVSFAGLEGGEAESSVALARAIELHGNVVVGNTFNRANQVVKPVSIIAESVAYCGYLEKIIDSDFSIRRSYLLRPYASSDAFESSFPLELTMAVLGKKAGEGRDFDRQSGRLKLPSFKEAISLGFDGSYVINYLAVESDFKRVSAHEVIEGQGRLDAFDGKTVLVGLSSALLGDKHPTPLGVMSGIAIHANELVSILSQRQLRFVSVPFVFLFSWILGVLVLFFFLFYRIWIGIFAFTVAFLGAFLGTQALFAKDLVLEPFLLFLGPVLGLVAGVLGNAIKLLIENKSLETKIIHDKLTGLYNYDFLRVRLEEEWRISKKTRQPLSLVMTDLDRFKKINDTLGHEVGNEMIKRAGAVLKQTARGYDVVARYGGDEFFVLLWHTGHEEASAYRERLRKAYHQMAQALEEPSLQDSSISIGLATFEPKLDPKRPENPQKLLEEADRDLLIDKESRRKPGEPRR